VSAAGGCPARAELPLSDLTAAGPPQGGGPIPVRGTQRPSATTRLVGVIGWPVEHSLSPALHGAAFAALDLDYAYVPLPVAPDRVGDAVRGLRALGFRGANVTIPHKAAVIPHLDWLERDAALAEAVNTIVVEDDGTLRGYNTDIAGFLRALDEVVGARGEEQPEAASALAPGAPALILGAGGAARAAALALARRGVALTVVNRTRLRAERLADLVASAVPGSAVAVASPDELGAALIASQRLLVNATPLGMAGAGKVPRGLADNVTAGQVVADFVYTSGLTDLLAQAQAQGAAIVDGLSVLVWQAAAAFELWTGVKAPVDAMCRAVGR
jgi:shikimate dehydrogenase